MTMQVAFFAFAVYAVGAVLVVYLAGL